MQIKFLEIRDRMTFIPALAIAPFAGQDSSANRLDEQESWLLGKVGYRLSDSDTGVVFLIKLGSGECKPDPYDWGNNHTMKSAHLWLSTNWDAFKSGDVLDCEFVRGEVPAPKISERLLRQAMGGA